MTIDPVTVLEQMRRNGVYEENRSRAYMLQLMDITPTAANVMEYVAIVRDKSLLRRIAETAENSPHSFSRERTRPMRSWRLPNRRFMPSAKGETPRGWSTFPRFW